MHERHETEAHRGGRREDPERVPVAPLESTDEAGQGPHGPLRASARWVVERSSLDLRSLALFRLGLGGVLLVDLFIRAGALGAHYTDAGVLPRSALGPPSFAAGRWSLHALDGGAGLQAAWFSIAAIAASALLLGYRTRLATGLSWLLLWSLHMRNPLVLQNGDLLLRLLLLWSLFLPLGARFSLDARRRPTAPGTSHRVATIGTLALTLQVCCVYWFAVALKSHRVWWTEASAVATALRIDEYATPAGQLLLSATALLPLLTRATVLLEAIGPVLVWVRTDGPLRFWVVVAFAGFHLALGAVLELGLFPIISVVGWLPFLPSWFWERLPARRPSARPGGSRPASLARAERTPLAIGFVIAGLLTYVLTVNLATHPFFAARVTVPDALRPLGKALGLNQRWNMFAPYPLTADGWYVVPGTLRDGTEVDLFTGGGPLRWEKPELVSATFGSQRWRKYLMNYWRPAGRRTRMHYARYLCAAWNREHRGTRRLEELSVYVVRGDTRPGRDGREPRRTRVVSHRCAS